MVLFCVPQRCATAGDSCNDILMLDGKMPAIVVSEFVHNYYGVDGCPAACMFSSAQLSS